MKRGDTYLKAWTDAKVQMEIPGLNAETQWSSTFCMIHQAYQARQIICMTLMKMEELRDIIIHDSEWKTAKALHEFLQQPEDITGAQSGSSYVKLSLSVKLLDALHRRCDAHIGGSDRMLQKVT